MRSADGSFYVVKFQSDPQNSCVPANEWLFCMKCQCRPWGEGLDEGPLAL